jgi:hypothetical protein
MSEKIPTIVIIAFILAFVLPIIGLILGIIALNKVNKTQEKSGKGLAIAAIIISAVTIPAILIFVGAIAYFGVLSPTNLVPSSSSSNNFIPERCTIQTGFECDVNYNNYLEFAVKNKMGRNIVIDEIEIIYQDFTCSNFEQKLLQKDEIVIFGFNNCDLKTLENKKIKFDFEINYYPEEVGSVFKTTSKGNFVITLK